MSVYLFGGITLISFLYYGKCIQYDYKLRHTHPSNTYPASETTSSGDLVLLRSDDLEKSIQARNTGVFAEFVAYVILSFILFYILA